MLGGGDDDGLNNSAVGRPIIKRDPEMTTGLLPAKKDATASEALKKHVQDLAVAS